MPASAAAMAYNNPGSFDSSNIGAGLAGAIINSGVGYLSENILSTTRNMHNTKDQSSLPGGYDSAFSSNDISSMSPIPLVYGGRVVAGPVAYYNVTGNNVLHIVTCLSLGPISQIGQIFINGIPSDRSDGAIPRFPDFDYEERFGTEFQTAFEKLIMATPEWTVEHRLRGVACLHTIHQGGRGNYDGFPTISALILGREILNIETGLIGYSKNPAYVIYDYLTNMQYGFGFETFLLDSPSFISSANYLKSVGIEINAIVDTSRNLEDNLKIMLGACRGMLIFSQGKFSLKIDKPELSTYTFEEKDMFGNISIEFFNASKRINRANVTWINRNNSFTADIMPIENPALVVEDDGQVVQNEIDLPFTVKKDTAFLIGMTEIQQSRINLPLISFTSFEESSDIKVGDVVTVNNTSVSDISVFFRVVEMRINQNHTINFECVGYNIDSYDIGPTPTTPDNVISDAPDPLLVPPPQHVIFEEKIFGVYGSALITWDLNVDANYSYQVSYRLKGHSNWSNIVSTYNNQLELINLPIGIYDIRVNAINAIGGISPPVIIDGEITEAAVMPRVSGLELSNGGGNSTIFNEPDADFYWRDASLTHSYQLGSEPFGGNAGGRDGYFSHYHIVIGYYQSYDNFVELRSEMTLNNHFSYTFDKNVKDGGPRRNITIRVTQVGNQSQESPSVAEISVSNPPPDAPNNIAIVPYFGQIDIMTTINDDISDFKYMHVWQFLTPSDPSAHDPILVTTDLFASIQGNIGQTYYIYIAYSDTFGPSSLKYSPAFKTTVLDSPDLTPPGIPDLLNLTQDNIITEKGDLIHSIVATWEKVADTDLQNYGWQIREGLGTISYGVSDKSEAPTFEFSPVISGKEYSVGVRAVDVNGNESDYSFIEKITITGDVTPPGPPTNLLAFGQLRGVLLVWTPPTDLDLDHFEIWESLDDNSDNSVLIASDTKSPFLRSDLQAGDVRFYWAKAVDRSGNVSIFNAINGTMAVVTTLVSGDVPNDLIVSNMIAANAIESEKIQANSITTEKLTANAVHAENIAAGAVTSASIKANAIDGDRITAGTLDARKIVSGTIKASKLITSESIITNHAQFSSQIVDNAAIKNLSVDNAKIDNLAVDNAKIAYAAVDTINIIDGAVQTIKIGDAQILTAKIGDLQVDAAKLGGSAVVTEKILKDAVTEVFSVYYDEPATIQPNETVRLTAININTLGRTEIDVVVTFSCICYAEIVGGSISTVLSARIAIMKDADYILPSQTAIVQDSNLSPGPTSTLSVTIKDTAVENKITQYALEMRNDNSGNGAVDRDISVTVVGATLIGRRK